MLFEIENVVDSASPFYYFFAITTLLLAVNSPTTYADLQGSGQFVVYRIHQLDLTTTKFGSRTSTFSLEALTPIQIDERFVRKCAIFKFQELLNNHYDMFIDKVLEKTLVSGVLILFDNKDFLKNSLNSLALRNLEDLEKRLLTNSTEIPIFFTEMNDQMNELYERYNVRDDSKTTQTLNLISKNVFQDANQLVITEGDVVAITNPVLTNFQIQLLGTGTEEQLPTYVIVTHYDAYSILPSLSFGADSNASGFVVFMELLRVFSRFYSNPKTRPKANLLFLLSGGGKLNYFGTKNWLEEHLESKSLNENIQFAMCLDGLADSMQTESLFMYVSKPPKPESSAGIFYENLLKVSQKNYPNLNVSLNHKKINLGDSFLSWEHERFSMKRISAFSLSSFPTSRNMVRRSILDRYDPNYVDALERSTNIIAETLSKQLYDNFKENIFTKDISRDMIASTFEHVSSISRSQQTLFTRNKGSNVILPEFLRFVQSLIRKYSSNHKIKLIHSKVDSSLVLYNPISAKLNVYTVKPALFDLLITIFIVSYISIFYYFVKHFSIIYTFIGTAKHSENGLSHRSKLKK